MRFDFTIPPFIYLSYLVFVAIGWGLIASSQVEYKGSPMECVLRAAVTSIQSWYIAALFYYFWFDHTKYNFRNLIVFCGLVTVSAICTAPFFMRHRHQVADARKVDPPHKTC